MQIIPTMEACHNMRRNLSCCAFSPNIGFRNQNSVEIFRQLLQKLEIMELFSFNFQIKISFGGGLKRALNWFSKQNYKSDRNRKCSIKIFTLKNIEQVNNDRRLLRSTPSLTETTYNLLLQTYNLIYKSYTSDNCYEAIK